MATFPLWHLARPPNNWRLAEEMAAYPYPQTAKGAGEVFIAVSGRAAVNQDGRVYIVCTLAHLIKLFWL